MRLRERGLVDARVGVEPRLRRAVLVAHGRSGAWLVGRRERALAVPSVARPVFVPERVVDGSDRVPKELMVGARIGRCGWHPFEVGQYVCLP